MKTIIVLGHSGMLGGEVYKYFYNQECNLIVTDKRFYNKEYYDIIYDNDSENTYIINCIGSKAEASINSHIPIFLAANVKNSKVIHCSTDAVFDGSQKRWESYSKTDTPNAKDSYGYSKIFAEKMMKYSGDNFKIIRSSILGFDKNNSSLLSWFLSLPQNSEVKGYVNYLWNGVTTKNWVDFCSKLVSNWDDFPDKIYQIGSKNASSKYDLLNIFREIFDRKDIKIFVDSSVKKNLVLSLDYIYPEIEDQIKSLKNS